MARAPADMRYSPTDTRHKVGKKARKRMHMIRKHFHFTGRVQGVGFRWRARHLALSYRLTGWVRNEWDDSVTLELQGGAEQINLVLKGLNQDNYIRIDWVDSQTIPVVENEKGFKVLY